MCGHCGCQGVAAIGELREEHASLADGAHDVRRALGAGDRAVAAEQLTRLVANLTRHVAREEHGIFTALSEQGDFAEEIEALKGEHLVLDAAVSALDPEAPDFGVRVRGLLDELDAHIEREDLGIFPVSVVTLGAAGWATVNRAHAELPTFLTERTAAWKPPHSPASARSSSTRPGPPPAAAPPSPFTVATSTTCGRP